MTDIKVGQVLSLRLRFNNNGDISPIKHPYLVVAVEDDYIEVAQFDSLEGKEHKAFYRGNKVVISDDPVETVIDKDSYIQMDNKFYLEKFDELTKYRRQEDTLSEEKLKDVIKAYNNFQKHNIIDDNKIVYLDKIEIISLN